MLSSPHKPAEFHHDFWKPPLQAPQPTPLRSVVCSAFRSSFQKSPSCPQIHTSPLPPPPRRSTPFPPPFIITYFSLPVAGLSDPPHSPPEQLPRHWRRTTQGASPDAYARSIRASTSTGSSNFRGKRCGPATSAAHFIDKSILGCRTTKQSPARNEP